MKHSRLRPFDPTQSTDELLLHITNSVVLVRNVFREEEMTTAVLTALFTKGYDLKAPVKVIKFVFCSKVQYIPSVYVRA